MGTISNPMGITAPTETGDSSDRARSSTVNGPLASLPGGLGKGALMIRSFTVVALMCMTSGETATAFDLKETLKDVMPCKYAAIRLCERPQHVNAAALWKCGATLAAAPQEEIGKRCVAVLKRYGAALN
jgi:hypothetical protein